MAKNPLDDSDEERHLRISQRAYHLWQSEGELHGHDQEYWERAKELIGMEESGATGQLPNPATVAGNDPSREQPDEESQIQENLGEFPGLTDQGEEQPFPTAAVTHTPPEDAVLPLSPPAAAKSRGTSAAPKKVSSKASPPAKDPASKPAPTVKAEPARAAAPATRSPATPAAGSKPKKKS